METAYERLRLIREELGYSQRDFAKALELEQSYLCAVEKGKKELTLKFLARLKNHFRVSMDWVHSGEGKRLLKKENDNCSISQSIEMISKGPNDDLMNLVKGIISDPETKIKVIVMQ